MGFSITTYMYCKYITIRYESVNEQYFYSSSHDFLYKRRYTPNSEQGKACKCLIAVLLNDASTVSEDLFGGVRVEIRRSWVVS